MKKIKYSAALLIMIVFSLFSFSCESEEINPDHDLETETAVERTERAQ